MTRTKKIKDSEVLRTALQVIIDKGPDSFTLEDVSRKTKLAPATLIQRFKTKEKLLLAALEQANEELRTDAETLLPKWMEQGIEGLIQYLCGLSRGVDRSNFAEHLSLLAKDFSEPRLVQLSNQHMNQVRRTIRSILEAAQQKGEIKTEIDLGELTFQIEALWHGSAIQWGFLKHGPLSLWIRERLQFFFLSIGRNPRMD